MKKSLVIAMVVIASIVLTVGIVQAATTRNVTFLLGGVSGDIFDVDGAMVVDSLRVGAQGVGGVTYFNGTIINETTDSIGGDVPVTFGDNVRIDGRVYRGATAGTVDSLPFIVNDNMEVIGALTVAGLSGTGIVSSDNIADGVVAAADLASDSVTSVKIFDGTIVAGDLADSSITSAKILDATIAAGDLASNSVTSAKITDGTIAADDLASDSVTSGKITDSTIATADLADDAVTPAKINGDGGANLPIAYGYCNSDGTTAGGTSNVSCSWDAGNSRYEITITGEAYFFNKYVTIVTSTAAAYIPETDSISDHLLVEFTSDGGVSGQQSAFGFVVFKY